MLKRHGFERFFAKKHFAPAIVTLCPGHCDTLPRCRAKCHKISFLQKIVKNLRRKILKIFYRMHFVALIDSFLAYQVLFKNIDKEKFAGICHKICDTEPRSPLIIIVCNMVHIMHMHGDSILLPIFQSNILLLRPTSSRCYYFFF